MRHDPVVIVGAARTPIGNFLGELQAATSPQLGAAAIKAAVERARLAPHQISESLMGCVLPAGLGQAPARQAALAAGLPVHAPATTVNKVCGSGLKTVMIGHDALLAGQGEFIVAGGMESMSNAPYLLPKVRQGYRMGQRTLLDHMMHDGLEDAYDRGKPMGFFAERCVAEYGFDRAGLDHFALNSLQRAQEATRDGTFAKEITPVIIKTSKGDVTVTVDEGPQTAKPEKIPHLKPAFLADGTVTAANSSSIADGAAALVLTRRSIADQHQLMPLATIVGHTTFAQTPEWFTTAPIGAIKKLMRNLNWDHGSVDLIEVNEAFAVVAMVTMQQLNFTSQQMNIHGGACALGHPIGASGARILVTLIYALHKYQLKRGIAALCLGGGEAVAVAVEVTEPMRL